MALVNDGPRGGCKCCFDTFKVVCFLYRPPKRGPVCSWGSFLFTRKFIEKHENPLQGNRSRAGERGGVLAGGRRKHQRSRFYLPKGGGEGASSGVCFGGRKSCSPFEFSQGDRGEQRENAELEKEERDMTDIYIYILIYMYKTYIHESMGEQSWCGGPGARTAKALAMEFEDKSAKRSFWFFLGMILSG